MNSTLFEKVNELNFKPKLVAEVGVYYPETSNILGFIKSGVATILVEPDPICNVKIKEYFAEYSNIQLYENAIFTENTEVELYRTNASTFVSSLESSPALTNDNYIKNSNDKFLAKAIKFSEIDSGNIDILSIDTEGCEWFVISTMVSRPKILSIETHAKKYKNPFLSDIKKWMEDNNYKIWYIDKSDTIYVTKDFIKLSRVQLLKNYVNMFKFQSKYLVYKLLKK